jgi:WD40 repeat protein
MMFASSSMDKTAKYYRCEAPNHFHFVSSTDMVAMPITAIAFDDEGKVLYTAANDTLKIWNMAKGGLLIETI